MENAGFESVPARIHWTPQVHQISHDPASLKGLTKTAPPPVHHPNTIHPPPVHHPLVPEDPSLNAVIAAWPRLSTEDRHRILAIVQGRGAP